MTGVARVAGDALQLPLQRKLPLHNESPGGSYRRQPPAARPGTVGSVPGQGHAGQVVQRPGGFRPRCAASRSRAGLAAAGVARLGRPRGNQCLDHGSESGMGGDERGQDADPPVHAVRTRDVLQLDRLRALPGALRTCLFSEPRDNTPGQQPVWSRQRNTGTAENRSWQVDEDATEGRALPKADIWRRTGLLPSPRCCLSTSAVEAPSAFALPS